jgi:ribosomal protein S18 acetylase RimI-like enzyme
MPELRVLPPAAHSDPMLAFLRTERAAADQVGQTEQLDAGLAVFNPDWPDVPQANRLLLAAATDVPTDAADALDSAIRFFASHACRLLRVELDPIAPEPRTAPLAAELQRRGYAESARRLLFRRAGVVAAVRPLPPDVMILPTRSALRQAAELARSIVDASPPASAHSADALLASLDDPHVDALIALQAGKPIGWVSVLAAGDVGRLGGLYVVPTHRRQGIGQCLLGRAMEIAARSLFRVVVCTVSQNDSETPAILQVAGFSDGGTVRRFDLAAG